MFGLIAFLFFYNGASTVAISPLPTMAWRARADCEVALLTMRQETQWHVTGACVKLDGPPKDEHHD